jgi:hypothetical protein
MFGGSKALSLDGSAGSGLEGSRPGNSWLFTAGPDSVFQKTGNGGKLAC